jgi:LysM repeat protein
MGIDSKQIRLLMAIAILAMATLFCSTNTTEEDVGQENLTALLSEIKGTVQVLKHEEGIFKDASDGQQIVEQDQVLTHEDGRVRLDLSTGTIIRLGPFSNFVLEGTEQSTNPPFTRIKLIIGELWIILEGGSIEVDTPDGIAAVRGSYMNVRVNGNAGGTRITCLEGICEVRNNAGAVELIAGQSATLFDEETPPIQSLMGDEDVQRWLEINPEASRVIPQLTATVGALLGEDEDQEEEAIHTPTPSVTPTAFDCGPPAIWVLYEVQEGETLASLASAYGITQGDLQRANCMGSSTTLAPGQSLFVPDRPTITPTPTLPSATRTPKPTSTPAPALPSLTPAPTDSPTTFDSYVGPVSGSISTCNNLYSIIATDSDGISFVKLEYRLNDPNFDGTTYYLLSQSGGTWSGTFSIDTTTAGIDTVNWRFWARDSQGNDTYFPAVGGFAYTDSLDCVGSP